MSTLLQEARFAVRSLLRRPVVTAVAVLSLAAGFAVSVGVFSLLDAAVLRPLLVRDPGALRVVLQVYEGGVNHNFSYPGYAGYRAAQTAFEDVVAYSATTAVVRRGAGTEVVRGELVSGNYFSAMGRSLALGRGLQEADDGPDAPLVTVLSRDEGRRPTRLSWSGPGETR